MTSREEAAGLLARLLRPEAERVLFVAAHPDDETLGGSWLLRNAPDCHVVHVTDGAPRELALRPPEAPPSLEAYAGLRAREAAAALGLAGIGPERVRCLGAVDQEAVLGLVPLARRLAGLLEELRPSVLVTHPYEGGHPDHDSAAFLAHAAVALYARAGRPAPALLEMTSYHSHDGRLVTGEFLPSTEHLPVTTVVLDEAGRDLKREMLACFVSQARVLAAFRVNHERFRPALRYDFTRPPHPGPLHYESLGWAMTGEQWRRLAAEALERLGLALPSGEAACR